MKGWDYQECLTLEDARAFARAKIAEGYEVRRYHYHVYWRRRDMVTDREETA